MVTVSPHPLLMIMPSEIRRQILIDTLCAEITEYAPHPFSYRVIPFDRLVHTVFAHEAYLLQHERHVLGPYRLLGQRAYDKTHACQQAAS